jgi:outer membrane protein assembly factor BamB
MATVTGLHCSRCGALSGSDDEFCGSCGGRLELPALPMGDDGRPHPPAAPKTARRLFKIIPRRLNTKAVIVVGVAVVVLAAAFTIIPGRSSASGLGTLPTNEPSEKWTFPLGEGTVEDVASAGGLVYTVTVHDNGAKLIATGLSDGKERWRSDLAGDVQHAQVFTVGGLVVAAGTSFSGDDAGMQVEAFSRSGKAAWSYQPSGDIQRVQPIGHDAVLVFSSETRRGSTQSTVTLVRSGKERWSADGTSATAVGDRVLVSDGDRLDAYRLDDGRPAWSVDTGQSASGSAIGDLVVVPDGKDVSAYRASDGKKQWSKNPGVGSISGTQPAGDRHVLINGADGSALLDRSGTITWDDNDTHHGDTLAVDGTLVMVESGDDRIQALDILSQAKLGSLDLDTDQVLGGSTGSPLARNGLLVEDNSRVRAYSLPALDQLWSFKVGDDRIVGLLALDKGVLALTTDGTDSELSLFR